MARRSYSLQKQSLASDRWVWEQYSETNLDAWWICEGSYQTVGGRHLNRGTLEKGLVSDQKTLAALNSLSVKPGMSLYQWAHCNSAEKSPRMVNNWLINNDKIQFVNFHTVKKYLH